MTPGINVLLKQKISHQLHEFKHDSFANSFGLEAVEKLQIEANRVFKTLVLEGHDQELIVAILPVTHNLSLKLAAKVMGKKKLAMAEASKVERSTGYVLGGVSPLGQKKRLKTMIDNSALACDTIFVSGGRRGLEIELSPKDLQMLLNARLADILQQE